MWELEAVDYIKDPIWNYIPITKVEKEIIKTNIFCRLRDISQMSLANTSFHGANHTRYEHSIGAMYVAHNLAVSMESKLREYTKNKGYDWNYVLQFTRLAGLLHDIGHPPFSHAIEEVFLKNPELVPKINGEIYSHDVYTQKIIKSNQEIKDIFKEYNFDPEEIANILGDKKQIKKTRIGFEILAPIFNSAIDADKIDYILRDNYYCGFPCELDLTELCNSLVIEFSDKNKKNPQIYLKRDHIHCVESLLIARLRLRGLIHFASNNRISNQMLMRAIAGWLKNQKNNLNEKEFNGIVQKMHHTWGEMDLNFEIQKSGENNTKIKYWIDLYKRAIKGELWDEYLAIHLRDLPPDVALSTFYLQKNPSRILDIQNSIENILKNKVISDFCFPHPPPLELECYQKDVTQKYKILTFTLSYLIKGVIRESFNKSYIYIYSNKKIDEKFNCYDLLTGEIIDTINRFRYEKYNKEIILNIDLILIILYALYRYERDVFPEKKLWAYSQIHLQDFCSSISNYLKKKNLLNSVDSPYQSYDEGFDINYFLDIEKLAYCGLIQTREEVFGFPTENSSYKYGGFRCDIRIDETWGIKYCEDYLIKYWKNLLSEIVNYLKQKDKNEIENYLNLQLSTKKYKDKDREVYKEKMTEIRTQLMEEEYLRMTT